MVAALEEYVAGGGHLVLTVRCGMKDQYNALLPERQPGALAEMAGVEVDDFYALLEPVPVLATWFEGQSSVWAERLTLIGKESARVIARYKKSNGWLDGRVAITVNSYGKGLVYYVGTYLDEAAQQILMTRLLKTAKVTTIVTPPGIEIGVRTRPDGGNVYIVINHTAEERPIQLPWPAIEHLSGAMITTEFKLPAYEVVVVTPLKK